MTVAITDRFHDDLVNILPRLRIRAFALTCNRAAADDLVQDTVVNALAARHSFTPGTNFPAWMHRILRNRFISGIRRRRETGDLDDVPAIALATRASQHDRLALQELDTALIRLPADQREALFMVVLEGLAYEEVAAITGCATGTAKSRVFRARRQLETWLTGTPDPIRITTGEPHARGSTRRREHARMDSAPHRRIV